MGDAGGRNPQRKKKILQISCQSRKRKYKIDHISKTKNRVKKVIQAKNERQINSNLLYKLGIFEKSLNFERQKRPF